MIPLRRDPAQGPGERTSRILWQNGWAALGCERIGHRHESWKTESAIGDHHLLAFPRVPFELSTSRGRVIADSNRVIFANPRSTFRRVALGPWGERSDWIVLDRTVLGEILASIPPAAEHENFSWVEGPAAPSAHLEQRRLFLALQRGILIDPLRVEELVLEIVRTAIRARMETVARRKPPVRSETRQARQELVHEAKRTIARRFSERLTLRGLAEPLGVTPFHLARIFRDETGAGLHAYLLQIRLRAALDRLPGAADKSRVAHAVGFSSHSHFSAAFRRSFGITPSEVRPSPG